MNQSPNPWHVSFSYARALQNTVLKTWKGARCARFVHCARCAVLSCVVQRCCAALFHAVLCCPPAFCPGRSSSPLAPRLLPPWQPACTPAPSALRVASLPFSSAGCVSPSALADPCPPPAPPRPLLPRAGEEGNFKAAQEALLKRAKANSDAQVRRRRALY